MARNALERCTPTISPSHTRSQSLREITRRMLADHGYLVLAAASSEEAVGMAAQGSDLVEKPFTAVTLLARVQPPAQPRPTP
jgi:hypothetical protein